MNIAVKVIIALTLALSLIGAAWAANWSSDNDPRSPAVINVNWSS